MVRQRNELSDAAPWKAVLWAGLCGLGLLSMLLTDSPGLAAAAAPAQESPQLPTAGPPSAVRAEAQQAREEGFAASNGAARHHALAGGIIGNQPLIPLKLRP